MNDNAKVFSLIEMRETFTLFGVVEKVKDNTQVQSIYGITVF